MYQNIIFLGGIHGVGKGTLSSKIQQTIEIEHLSASEVLKWSEVNLDPSNKLVKDITETQHRLIKGLQSLIEPNKKYLLDGHFCLLNSAGSINAIAIETFIQISPILISVVTCNTKTILDRLEHRDNRKYDLHIIEEMQSTEVRQGRLIAKQLGVPFLQQEGDITELIEKIKSL